MYYEYGDGAIDDEVADCCVALLRSNRYYYTNISIFDKHAFRMEQIVINGKHQ